MRKVLLLLFTLVLLLAVLGAGANKTLYLSLPIATRPVIAQSSVTTPINSTTLPSFNEPEHETFDLRFSVISDIHVKKTNPDAQNKFLQMLGDMEKLHIPNLVINGDLGDGGSQDYQTLANLIRGQKNSPTIYYTIGNHEFYQAYHNPISKAWSPETFPNGETDDAALKRFLKLTGRNKVYYDEYINGYHFIFLGSEKSAISDRTYGDRAFLSNEQLGWLETKLQENYLPSKPIFVFLHQPLIRLGSTNNEPSFIIQSDQLQEILNRFPEVFFFHGHIHRQLEITSTIRKEEFVMVNSSSVALPRDAIGNALPKQSEGLIVEVLKNKVVIKGRDFLAKTWIPEIRFEL